MHVSALVTKVLSYPISSHRAKPPETVYLDEYRGKVQAMSNHENSSRAADVLRATFSDSSGDGADQAVRLSMIMEAEALNEALRGRSGEGDLDGYLYPLEDSDEVLSMEDADDGSDDPRHAGEASVWRSAEESAMHVVGAPDIKEFLTPEDETLLGLDPYED